jgi:hypothetical protein
MNAAKPRDSGDDELPEELERKVRDFADPVASATAWTSLRGSGSNFPILALVEMHAHRLEFRVTREFIRFSRIIAAFGLAPVVISLLLIRRTDFWFTVSGVTLGGLIVFGSVAMLRYARRPRVLDRTLGWYWEGAPPLKDGASQPSRGSRVPLSEVHAIQVLSSRMDNTSSDGAGLGTYLSLEINFVKHDGSRVSICSQGGPNSSLRGDAGRIARFLDVPVWDAVL